ncbi:Dienelactone hydrolase family protein [Micromonospora viridifaciens]|uniref:Dienelactone hydrolase family protein n=1 Tax=Micromonospora viridifaciens TaxID=1881 RepID=A0A1C4Y209_MICVI|nr:Dienelactone hydrolase family protein [Micromonospora viridifaciens]
MNALRAIEAHPDRIAAAAVFHAGRLVTDAPDSPQLAVGAVTGELYFGHADQDPSMTAEQIATLEKALDAAGVAYLTRCIRAPRTATASPTPRYTTSGPASATGRPCSICSTGRSAADPGASRRPGDGPAGRLGSRTDPVAAGPVPERIRLTPGGRATERKLAPATVRPGRLASRP